MCVVCEGLAPRRHNLMDRGRDQAPSDRMERSMSPSWRRERSRSRDRHERPHERNRYWHGGGVGDSGMDRRREDRGDRRKNGIDERGRDMRDTQGGGDGGAGERRGLYGPRDHTDRCGGADRKYGNDRGRHGGPRGVYGDKVVPSVAAGQVRTNLCSSLSL